MSLTNEQVNSFYQRLLESTSLTVVDDIVHQNLDGNDSPVQVGGKTLILPTMKWLGEPDWSQVHAFHPLAESILRKESPTFKFLRKLYMIRITQTALDLLGRFVEISAHPEKHEGLNPITQVPMLSCAPKADDKLEETVKKLAVVLAKGIQEGEQKLFNMVVLRGKDFKGKKYSRICKVTFPVLEELKKDGVSNVYGVKLRKSDIPALTNLIQYIFEDILTEKEDAYCSATHGQTAPSFYVLTQSYVKLMESINKRAQQFGISTLPLDFAEELSSLDEMRNTIPVLPGNDGEVIDGEEQTTEERKPTARGSYEEYVPQDQRTESNYKAPPPIGSKSAIKRERVAPQEERSATYEDLFGGSNRSDRDDRRDRRDDGRRGYDGRRVDRNTLRGSHNRDYNTREQRVMPRSHYLGRSGW